MTDHIQLFYEREEIGNSVFVVIVYTNREMRAEKNDKMIARFSSFYLIFL
jgi:hypothetical protein